MVEHGRKTNEQEASRPATRPKRLWQAGKLLLPLLALNPGIISAVSAPKNNNPEVDRQIVTDVLNNTGSFETPANPPTNPATPDNWGMVIRNPSNPPVYDYNDGIAHIGIGSVRITTDGTTTCESNGWITLQDFPVDPTKTYSLDFRAGYESSGNKVLPQVIVDWKNSAGQSLNSSDISTLTSNGNPDPVDNWYAFNRTYGPGQDSSIPQNASKGSMEIEGDPTGACSGTLHLDTLSMTTTDPLPTPTRQPGVGGIASQPDLDSLPKTSVTHSTRNTIVEIAAGAAALAGTIAVAEAFRRKNRQS